MLAALAKERGVSMADVLRMSLRDLYADKFGEAKPPAITRPTRKSRAA